MSETVHFHICFVEDSIGAFMAKLCYSFSAAKDALLRSPCCNLSETMAHGLWIFGCAGS